MAGICRQSNLVKFAAGGALAALAAVLLLRFSGVTVADLLDPLQTLAMLGHLRPQALLEALAFSTISILLNGVVWSRLLARLGYDLPGRVGLSAFLSSDLAGYVANLPGSAVGCVVNLRRHGVCPGRAVLLSVIANVLGFCSILVWVPVGLVLLARAGMDKALPVLGPSGPLVAAGMLVCMAIVMLVLLQALAAAAGAGSTLARRLLGRSPDISPAHHVPPLRLSHLLALVPWSAASWFAGALALYAVLGALDPTAQLNLGDIVGSCALAAMLGSLAFFVPAGVGVRDGALVALLAHSTGLPIATCTLAAIAVRALDPVTKVGMLLVLASGIAGRLLSRISSRARTLRAAYSFTFWWAQLLYLRGLALRLPRMSWSAVTDRE